MRNVHIKSLVAASYGRRSIQPTMECPMSVLSTPNFQSVVGAAKIIPELSAAPIAALSALAFVSTCAPASAHAYEYCRQDVSSHMLQCSFDTLEQCKWTSSGRGGVLLLSSRRGRCVARRPYETIEHAIEYVRNSKSHNGPLQSLRNRCSAPTKECHHVPSSRSQS